MDYIDLLSDCLQKMYDSSDKIQTVPLPELPGIQIINKFQVI